ncbi:MAG: RnfABCDGE type electron transport complex subunit C [Phycisphaerae bacterium]|nr:RnfABCDGE type electron transport complex subunit C [Phycisphaerae bacterium]
MVRHKGFPGGAILPNDKGLSEGLEIQNVPVPSTVQVALDDGAGGSAEPTAQPGRKVSCGECIAVAQNADGVNVHSPVAGQVRQIDQIALADGTPKPAMIIDTSGEDQSARAQERLSWKVYSEGLIKCLRWAGITRMHLGGGSLVARIRKATKAGLRWVIINAVESEPLITCESRLITECSSEIARGCELLAEVFALSSGGKKSAGPRGILALCAGRHRAVAAMGKALQGGRFRLAALADVYPQDEEALLANTLTNAGLPARSDPAEAGVLVINVSSVWALSQAWYDCKPLTERVITVSGDGTERIGNYRGRIGTSVQDIAQHVGLLPEASVYILGGPFRGWAREKPQGVITKNITGLTILSEADRQGPVACIRCGWCSDDCPAAIEPLRLYQLIEAGRVDKAQKAFLQDCIECGLCSYVCPSHLPLLEKIRLGKKGVRLEA